MWREPAKLGEVACHGIFDQIVGSATRSRGKFVETRLGFGLQMDHHGDEFRRAAAGCQSETNAAFPGHGPANPCGIFDVPCPY